MIQRIIPVVIGVTLLISGCVQKPEQQDVTGFSMGATLLKVAHLPSPTADGSSLFITIDGKDAGLLPVGEAMLFQVPAGEHQVGGYARSLIGSVTIRPLTVTTSPDAPRFVAYRVTRNAPLFIQRGVDPLPQSAPLPEKQVAQFEPLPVPQIVKLSLPESEPVADPTPGHQEGASPTAQEEKAPTSDSTNTITPVVSDASQEVVSPPKSAEAPASPSQPAVVQISDPVSQPAPAQEVKALKPMESIVAETPVAQQKTPAVTPP